MRDNGILAAWIKSNSVKVKFSVLRRIYYNVAATSLQGFWYRISDMST